MSLKEFDYKQFLLEKGERVGLGVAVSLMVLMLIWSLFMPSRGFFSGSPSKNAEALATGAKQLETALNTAEPNESQKPGEAQGRLTKLDTVPLNPNYYVLEPIIPSERGENPTRRPPNILNVVESAVEPAFIPVDTYIFVGREFSSIVVLRDKEGRSGGGPAPARGGDKGNPMMQMMQRNSSMMNRMMGGGGSGGGSGDPRMSMMRRFGASQGGGLIQGAEEKREYEPTTVPLKNLDPNAHLARQLRPARMAIVAASFPYKAQLEEFKKKLHKSSIQEVLEEGIDEGKGTVAAFRFLGVKVERKEVDANGKDVKPWAEIDFKRDYAPWLLVSGEPFEPDDPKYDLVKPDDGLVMSRLREFREEGPQSSADMMGPGVAPPGFAGANAAGEEPRKTESKYRDVAGKLQKIAETLTKLEGVKPKQIARVPERFRKNKDFDPFHPNVSTGDEQAPAGGGAKPEEVSEEATIPEYCLARFVDVTVEPGKFYRYRVKVRMANPNYGRADVASPEYKEKKELESKDWFEIPQTVNVPPELHYYVCDQKQIDKSEKHPKDAAIWKLWQHDPSYKDRQVVFQLHRWVESTPITPKGEKVPVGEWAIADRVFVYRGEFVGQPVKVDVPVWKYTQDSFVLPAEDQRARPTRTGRLPTGVTINFGPENDDDNTILVDFDGPRHYREFTGQGSDGQPKTIKIDDTTGIEVLMLSPEGKLLARNSLADTKDDKRTKRREKVMKRLQDVREGKSSGPSAPGGGLDAPGGGKQQ